MFSTPEQSITNRSKPSPKPACGTEPYCRSSPYHLMSSGFNPTYFARSSSTSSESSRWEPPIISPMRGTRMSMAATVFPSSFSFM